jgi:Mrp family chromosome partitioning ATPase
MERLLRELTADYDVVLLDTPPLLPVTDAGVLSSLVGGTLLVIGADRVHRPQLQQAIESLETAGAHLHGVVVNKIARQESAAYAYDAGYEPLPAADAVEAAAPKRARPEVKYHRPVNGLANGSAASEQSHRSREATPVPR